VQVVLDRIGKVRLTPPTRDGGPKAPVNPLPVRVSTTRQGSIATKTSGFAPAEKPVASAGVATTACPWVPICVGCQYSGAAQCFNGRGSPCLPTWADSTNDTTAVNETRRNELFRFIRAFAFLGPLSNIISPKDLSGPDFITTHGNWNFCFAILAIDYPTASVGAFFFILLPTLARLPPHAEHRSRAPARRASQKIMNRSGESRTHGKGVDATMRLLCRQTLPKISFQRRFDSAPRHLVRTFITMADSVPPRERLAANGNIGHPPKLSRAFQPRQ
jgi:hypothetical protein